jgi:hypothetical protein
MLQLIYTSTAVSPCDTETLGNLLIQARARNLAKDITGMLLYDFGRFLQVLEGPDENVERVFASVQRDPRHTDIVTLSKVPIEFREFQYWSMAFLDLSTAPHSAGRPMKMSDVLVGADCALNAKRYLREFQGDETYRLAFREQSQYQMG